MPTFITYFRVSTDRQGKSGLGLDAQRAAVSAYVAGIPGATIAAEFTEVESGRKTDRPQLTAALAACKQRGATLAIAKLDRLARNVFFVSGLMESGVEFVAVDMPYANRFTVHIMAAVAEHEREMISKRTTDALAAAKARGRVLGNPRPAASLARGRDTRSRETAARRDRLRPLLAELRDQGLSDRALARELNRRGLRTEHGAPWHGVTVRRVLGEARPDPDGTGTS